MEGLNGRSLEGFGNGREVRETQQSQPAEVLSPMERRKRFLTRSVELVRVSKMTELLDQPLFVNTSKAQTEVERQAQLLKDQVQTAADENALDSAQFAIYQFEYPQ